MHCFKVGLCVCLVGTMLTACAQDKKLPQGERLSVLDDFSYQFVDAIFILGIYYLYW